MILAAGRGERLRPLTDKMPKPLVKANGKPLIVYHLEKLAACGVTEVVINHAWLGHMLEETLGDGRDYGLSISYSAETEALETAGGIVKALPLLGKEPFLVINGDVFIDELPDLEQALTALKTHQALAYLWLVENPEHHLSGDFALVPKDGANRLTSIGENKYTFSGIGVYNPQFFSHVAPGKAPLGPLLKDAMQQGQVLGEKMSQYWCDVGTLARLEGLNQRLRQSSF